MDVDLECLLCGKNDLNLYEINNNSVLIGADLIDFQDIIYDIFSAKVSFNSIWWCF